MSDRTLNWLRAWLPLLNLVVVGVMIPWGVWVTSSIYDIKASRFTHSEGNLMAQRVSVNEKDIAVLQANLGSIRMQLDRIESILREMERREHERNK